MTEAFLTRPHTRYKLSFIAAAREFIKEGTWHGWKPSILQHEFESYVDNTLLMATDPPPGLVPQTDYWLIVDGETYAGRVSIRHHLIPGLERYGGHIGYEVRPTQRLRGYGTLMCRLGIVEARRLGIQRILITCDDDNIGSQKIIEANGGVLTDKVDNGRYVLTRRYWIEAPE